MFEAWREIFSSGEGEGMAKKGREEVAMSIVWVSRRRFEVVMFVTWWFCGSGCGGLCTPSGVAARLDV